MKNTEINELLLGYVVKASLPEVGEGVNDVALDARKVLQQLGIRVFMDGDAWCLLLGDNLQEGICGFGDTLDQAISDFCKSASDRGYL